METNRRRVIVGNDIVDLENPRVHGKAEHARFVERVFTDHEAASITEASDPDRQLWVLWAAKEAAYKVASRLAVTPPVFAHRSFVVHLLSQTHGHVDFEGTSIPFALVNETTSYIHVVAWSGDPNRPHPPEVHFGLEHHPLGEVPPPDELPGLLEAHFSPREADQIRRVESALVRLYAKRAIGDHLDVAPGRVLILAPGGADGRTPPEVELVNLPGHVTLSLSHDGRHYAWCFAYESKPGGLDVPRAASDVASQ